MTKLLQLDHRHCRLVVVAWLLLTLPAVTNALDRLTAIKNGGSFFIRGSLATLNQYERTAVTQDDHAASVVASTSQILNSITEEKLGATGQETLTLAVNQTVTDESGNKHLRFSQTYEGLPVVDAAIMMHLSEEGVVYAVNGEIVVKGAVDMNERVTCEKAFANVFKDPKYGGSAVWLSTACLRKVVFDKYGVAHKAWERMIGYQPKHGPYQKDRLYASVVTGAIVATRPTVYEADSPIPVLDTRNCNNSIVNWNCQSISTSSELIDNEDQAIEDAHNFAIATYNFFYNNFHRDSIDGQGMTIISNVHVDYDYNNAYWDGFSVNYGDGDGYLFSPLSEAPDVVAHEVSHGITQYSSNLIYQDEPGALNEAMSDIFGACVDYQEGARGDNTWFIGEDVYTPDTPGDALRYMMDPKRAGDYDFYPTRYRGYDDFGGVHWNSGIANLAFVLMVQGGEHPRKKTSVNVLPLDGDFNTSLLTAASIFYNANVACLTPMSRFMDARECTLLHAGPKYNETVAAAWAAVGVDFKALPLGEKVTIPAAVRGEVFQYVMTTTAPGTKVTCTLEGDNGDADLFVEMMLIDQFFAETLECTSQDWGSNEVCAVGPFYGGQKSRVYVTVKAFVAFKNVTLQCVGESTWVALSDGVSLEGQRAYASERLSYYLLAIPPLTVVTCEVNAPNTLPYIEAYLVADDYSTSDDCYIWYNEYNTEGSATCIMDSGWATSSSVLYLSFFNEAEKFSEVTLTCTLEPAKIKTIANWAVTDDADIGIESDTYSYSVSHYLLDNTVEPGESVSCIVNSSSTWDMTVFLHFVADLSDPVTTSILGCASYTYGSISGCTTEPTNTSTHALLELRRFVYNSTTAQGLEVVCGVEPSAVNMQFSSVLTKQQGTPLSDSALQTYSFPVVYLGEKVTCSISGDNGDADMYVDIGFKPHPLSGSIRSMCNTTRASSKEVCVLSPAPYDGNLYVSVHAVESYTDLNVSCTRDSSTCKAKGSPCRRIMECCGSRMTCDGPTSTTRVCKRARRFGRRCVRKSQCWRSGATCVNGMCDYS